ncbi:hypothetical protein H7142_00600 [Candidatus Saccharibacteria bacterium]|nr:hypothetical protein [Candidatus Saccharibacteria bacterium]
MLIKRKVLLGSIGIVIAAGAITTYFLSQTDSRSGTPAKEQTSVSLIDKASLDSLPKVDRSKADISHLTEGMIPPTNTWFSGLALQKDAEPAFSYPNSVRPTNQGFEFSLPNVTATADTIIGPHGADLVVSIDGAVSYKITRYDELTVELGFYSSDGTQLASVTLAAGSPYVYVTAKKDTSLTYGGNGVQKDDAWSILRNNSLYGLKTDGQVTDGTVKLPTAATATFFSAPDTAAFSEVASHALNIVAAGSVSYDVRGTESVTTLSYTTNNDEPTLIARLPHQQNSSQDTSTVEYASVLGKLTSTVANSIEYSVPRVEVTGSLPVSKLNESQRAQLMVQLKKDVSALPEPLDDTYFGSKQLQRTAQLLVLADQLGASEQKDILKAALNQRLTKWLSKDGAFQFDTKAHTIVGKETSFGADTDINDHHFHYGYIIYAAAVLAKYDDTFRKQNESVVNLLVADISNFNADETLPQRRNYDPYFGHSWASGTAPFKDGNNQESTSEAINAWTAVGLWAKQTKNQPLENQAVWMVSNEIAAAKEYWLTKPTINGYTAPIVSIVWGGKREYKTFFSDDPNAKLAILLLPLNPSMREYANSIVKTAFTGTSTARPFGDYLLMADPDATVQQAEKLPDSAIDDGNSRTYLYAYVMTK